MNCFRVFESGSNLIGAQMQKVEFYIPCKIQQTTVFQDFRIATFPLDFIMYEVKRLSFNQAHQPLYVP